MSKVKFNRRAPISLHAQRGETLGTSVGLEGRSWSPSRVTHGPVCHRLVRYASLLLLEQVCGTERRKDQLWRARNRVKYFDIGVNCYSLSAEISHVAGSEVFGMGCLDIIGLVGGERIHFLYAHLANDLPHHQYYFDRRHWHGVGKAANGSPPLGLPRELPLLY